jgi:hypothetical protein
MTQHPLRSSMPTVPEWKYVRGMLHRPLIVLLLAFAASVALRWPLLDRPLSGHHEFCTAFSLIMLQNWHADGICAHNGTPALTFSAAADRHSTWMGHEAAHANGRYHYLSHPPLGLYLPHVAFALFGAAPSPLGLQAFNLLLHALLVLAVWRLILAVGGQRAALYAALLAIFMPAPLWFLGNAYMSDIMVVVPWAWHLVAAQGLFSAPPQHRMRLWPFTLSLLVTVYSGWLGLLAAAVDVLLLLRSEVLRTQRVRIAGAIAVAVVTPMALTALSYASVVGGRGLLDYLLSRLVHRSSLGPAASGWQGVWQVLENFRTGFLPVMVVLLAALPFVLRGWWDGVLRLTPRVKVLLVLTGLPVLLEHMLLLDYAAHDFVALKATPLLVAAVVLLLEGAARQPWRMRMPGTVLVLVLCAAGAAYFRHINAPGGSAVHRDRGTFVAQHIRPEERFFWSGPSPEPQLVWYAQRTPWSVRNVEEAREALARHGEARGVLFRPSPDGSGLEAIRVVP